MIKLNPKSDLDLKPTLIQSSGGPENKSLQATIKTGLSECKSRDLHGPQHKMTRLDPNFKPGGYDVICARGGEAKNHIGNLNFRKKVAELAGDYASAHSRIIKSSIVSSIIDWVHTKSPAGGFVRDFDGIWYEVGDRIAREKVGQALREMNHGKYKSSMRAKRVRWKEEKQTKQTCMDGDVALKTMLKNHHEAIEKKWQICGSRISDAHMLHLFTQHNRWLLETVKEDKNIQEQINNLV